MPKTTKSCQCRKLSQACQTTTPSARKGTTVTIAVAMRSAVSLAHGSTSSALRALSIVILSCRYRCGAKPEVRRYHNGIPAALPTERRATRERRSERARARARLQLGDLASDRVDDGVELGHSRHVALAQQ